MANMSKASVSLTFLQLGDPLQEGVEGALRALAVGRRLVVQLALLLLQFGHLAQELVLQGAQPLPQQLPQLWRQRRQSRDSRTHGTAADRGGGGGRGGGGRGVGGGEAQTLLLERRTKGRMNGGHIGG